jgi:hypothetical protein
VPDRSDVSQLTESPQSEKDAAEWAECQRLARQCGIPCVRLRDRVIDPELVKKLPIDVLDTYKMVPIKLEGYVITIARRPITRYCPSNHYGWPPPTRA